MMLMNRLSVNSRVDVRIGDYALVEIYQALCEHHWDS
jgi:hypothetical protein